MKSPDKIIIFFALLVNCAYAIDPQPEIAVPMGEQVIHEPINILTKVSQEFTIALPVNVSTGYDWYWQVNEPTTSQCIELVKKETKPYHQEPGFVGGGATSYWTFHALRSGNYVLVLNKRRIWEKNSDIDLRRFNVEVKPRKAKIKK